MSTSSDRTNTRSVGILFGDQCLRGCHVIETTFGGVRYEHARVDVLHGDLQSALDELLQEMQVGSQSASIYGALSINESVIATRPDVPGEHDEKGGEPASEDHSTETQKTFDKIHWTVNNKSIESVIAAPSCRVDEIRDAIAKTPHRLEGLFPAECRFIADAQKHDDQEHGKKIVTRVFVGKDSLLTTVCCAGRALHWESTPLIAGDEGTAIVSVVRRAESECQRSGLSTAPERVVIHGRPELARLLDRQWLEQNLPANYRWVDTPSAFDMDTLDDDFIRSIADGHRLGSGDGFDLIRRYREPVPLRRLVSLKEIIAYVIAACVLASVLGLRIQNVNAQRAALVDQVHSDEIPANGILKNADDVVDSIARRDVLRNKANAIHRFLEHRVQWSEMISEISQALPDGTYLTGIRGANELQTLGGDLNAQKGLLGHQGNAGRQLARTMHAATSSPATLVIHGECELRENETLPSVLATLAEAVREIELVSKHFDTVELTELRQSKPEARSSQGVQFAVVLTKTHQGAR